MENTKITFRLYEELEKADNEICYSCYARFPEKECKPWTCRDHVRRMDLINEAKEHDNIVTDTEEPNHGLLAGLAQSLANKLGQPIAIEPAGIHAEPAPNTGGGRQV